MLHKTLKEQFANAPPVTDVSFVVSWVRAFRGPDSVEVRRESEDRAIGLLDASAGAMTRDQAVALGRVFNTDSRGGEVRHDFVL